MTTEEQARDATELLHQILEQQRRVADEAAEANHLERERLAQRQIELDQEQARLDLEDRKHALQREAETRKEHRLNEVLQRYITAEEKLIALDDAFGDTVQRLIVEHRAEARENIDAQVDILQALYALLTREQASLQEAGGLIKSRLQRERMREELLQRRENLADLEMRAAKHGALSVPTGLTNEIEAERQRIEQLEKILS